MKRSSEMSAAEVNAALGLVEGLNVRGLENVVATTGGSRGRVNPKTLRIESTNKAVAAITGLMLEDDEPKAYAGLEVPQEPEAADELQDEENEGDDKDKMGEEAEEDMQPGGWAGEEDDVEGEPEPGQYGEWAEEDEGAVDAPAIDAEPAADDGEDQVPADLASAHQDLAKAIIAMTYALKSSGNEKALKQWMNLRREFEQDFDQKVISKTESNKRRR